MRCAKLITTRVNCVGSLIFLGGKAINPELSPLESCPVCSSTRRKSIYQLANSRVQKCLDCGLKYLDPCLSSKAMKQAYESDESLMAFHEYHEGYYEYGDVNRPSATRTEFLRELDL